jgi:hypothetical protein
MTKPAPHNDSLLNDKFARRAFTGGIHIFVRSKLKVVDGRAFARRTQSLFVAKAAARVSGTSPAMPPRNISAAAPAD